METSLGFGEGRSLTRERDLLLRDARVSGIRAARGLTLALTTEAAQTAHEETSRSSPDSCTTGHRPTLLGAAVARNGPGRSRTVVCKRLPSRASESLEPR